MERRPFLLGLLPLVLAAACTSNNQENVCYNIGLCESQSDTQISSCQVQANELGDEAFDAGCGPLFDTYFGCANGAYTCEGNKPLFPGCEGHLASLNSCLEAGQASTSCGALASALAACPGYDAGSSGPVPSPCTASGVCSANCYLTNVPNVCAPLPAQLTAFQTCAAVCI